MPEEFGEHLIKDQRPFLHTESLQILQIHSSMTVLLLFSSPHSFSVGFRSEDRDSNGKIFILCSVTHFCVYFDVCFGLLSWWKIHTRPNIRFLTEAVRFWFFICWYLIESMMPCIWTRCSGPPAEKQAHNIKDPAVYLTVDMGYFFIPVCTKLIWWVCCQKAIFSVSSDKKPVPFEVPVVSDNWICWSLFLDEWGQFFLKPSRTTCGDIGDVWFFFFRFLTPRLN